MLVRAFESTLATPRESRQRGDQGARASPRARGAGRAGGRARCARHRRPFARHLGRGLRSSCPRSRADEPTARTRQRHPHRPASPVSRDVGAHRPRLARSGYAPSRRLRIDPRAMVLVPREVCEKHSLRAALRRRSRASSGHGRSHRPRGRSTRPCSPRARCRACLANERLIRFVLAWNHGPAKSGPTATSSSALDPDDDERSARRSPRTLRDRWARHFATRTAIQLVRAMPEMTTSAQRRPPEPDRHRARLCAASLDRSPAIYVLVVVFPGPFDELRAKHAISQALPIIESARPGTAPSRSPSVHRRGAKAMRSPIRR